MRYPTSKKGSLPYDYGRPTSLLPTEPVQLLAMTECRPHPVLHPEVIRDTGVPTPGGLAPSGECLQLHSPLLGIPWLPLLERTDDRPLYLPQGPRPPAHKCIGHLLPNDGNLLPPHHN